MIDATVSLVGLPFYSMSRYNGMGLAVSALRRLGIADVISNRSRSFRDRGDVTLSTIMEDSGPQNLRNFPQFIEDTKTVYRAISGWEEPDDFVFCLGGECALVTGAMAAFRKRFEGRPGILWMDAHGDFNTPDTSPSGFIGGMCLALTCGRGPHLTDEIERSRPLVTEENVIHVGSRALDSSEAKAMEDSALELYPTSKLHQVGTPQIAEIAAHNLAERCDWIVCHLDVDVIDPRTIPAVNFPTPGDALTMEEVVTIVKSLRDTGKLKVFNLTAYNPMMDNYNYECGTKILKLVSNAIS